MQQDLTHQLLDQAQSAANGGMPDWLPPAGIMVAVGSVLVGVIVWLFGGKLIKPGFVLVGGVVGAACGAVYVPSMTATIAGMPAAYPGMAIGLLLGMIAAVIVYRFAMATLSAGVLGLGAVLAGIVALSYVPGAIPPPTAITQADGKTVITADGSASQIKDQVEQQVRDWSGRLKDAAQKYKDAQTLTGAGTAAAGSPAPGSAEQDAADKERIEAAKRTAQAISEHVAERWQALPQRSRLVIAGSWMAGAMAGFLLGLLLPNKAAAAVSALTGGAMVIAGSASLADRYTSLGPWLAGVGAMGWLGAWMVVSAIGLLHQSKRKKSPPPATAVVVAPAK